MKNRAVVFSILTCLLAAGCLSICSSVDVDDTHSFHRLVGAKYSLIRPCYLSGREHSEDGVSVIPYGNWGGIVYPAEEMQSYVGKKIGGIPVVGVLPAGTRLQITRVYYRIQPGCAYLCIGAVTESGRVVDLALDMFELETEPLTGNELIIPNPAMLDEEPVDKGRPPDSGDDALKAGNQDVGT